MQGVLSLFPSVIVEWIDRCNLKEEREADYTVRKIPDIKNSFILYYDTLFGKPSGVQYSKFISKS